METILTTTAGSYRWHENWVAIPPSEGENGRTHAVAESKSGNLILFHQANPAVLTYSAEGVLLSRWGNYQGAHGLTLVEERGVEYLWLTDQDSGAVHKTTLGGAVVLSLAQPDHPAYRDGGHYSPTWVAVNEVRHGGNGDIWVADGYGSGLVHRHNAQGAYLMSLDGTEGAGRFHCPHAVGFDFRRRNAPLLIADRGNKRFQIYDAEGCYQSTFGSDFLSSPCGFAIQGDRLVVPELKGRLAILDAENRLIAHLGDHEAICTAAGWPNTTPLEPGKCSSPHGAGVDADGNIFVAEWRVGGRVIKLEKLG